MPTNIRHKTRSPVGAELPPFADLHLLFGDCLVAAASQLCVCTQVSDNPHCPCPRPLRPDARDTWFRYRAELLEQWTRELARLGAPAALPTFAEIVYEHAVLPPADPAWPEPVRTLHHTVAANAAAQRAYWAMYPEAR